MRNYTFILSTLLTIIFITGCGAPEPKKKFIKPTGPVCTIDKLSAPNWCCDGNLNSRYVSVYSHNPDKNLATDVTYWNFQEELFNYLKGKLLSIKDLHLSKQDIRAIANATILDIDFIHEEWKGKEYYVLYKVKKSIADEILAQNIETYQHTRVYENCFKTGKISLEKSCKKKIKDFLQTTPLKDKRTIVIEVHTDKSGSSHKNLAISIRRAYTAASSLYYKEYKNSKVYYAGFGESQPLVDGECRKANIINRRVVVSLKDKYYKVPKKIYKRYVQGAKKKKTKRTTVRVAPSSTVTIAAIAPVMTDVLSKKKKKVVKKAPVKRRIKNVNLVRYTGKADTGWMYFGPKSLSKKFYVSCADDKPTKVKRKAISKSKKSEFISGLYGKRISGNFGDNYVEINPVYMFENGAIPKSNPVVTLYGNERNIERFQTTVNTFRGQKGILYRIFVNGNKKMECMDLVIPYSTKNVSYGRVYMNEANGKLKEYKFTRE